MREVQQLNAVNDQHSRSHSLPAQCSDGSSPKRALAAWQISWIQIYPFHGIVPTASLNAMRRSIYSSRKVSCTCLVVFMQKVSGESFAGPGFLGEFRQCLELPRLITTPRHHHGHSPQAEVYMHAAQMTRAGVTKMPSLLRPLQAIYLSSHSHSGEHSGMGPSRNLLQSTTP